MSLSEIIEHKLREKLAPSHLEVVNESYKHQGHAGDDGSGESHFKVVVSSDKFEGMNRVATQRMIFGILAEEMKVIHALSINVQK